MKFVDEVCDNVRLISQFHLENFHASPAHHSDISSGEIMVL
jgi:hypothetical protein